MTKNVPLSNHQSGFTLLELAVVFMIVSVGLGGGLMLLRPYMDGAKYNGTEKRLENIGQSLAAFAKRYGRLPCPATPDRTVATEPFGAPRGSGLLGQAVTARCRSTMTGASSSVTDPLEEFVGIVPFKALGLSEEAVRDSYGNFITYAASPIVTGGDATPGPVGFVHAMCRQQNWIRSYDPGPPIVNGHNLNPEKAALCCPVYDGSMVDTLNTNNIEVHDENGIDLFTLPFDNTGADYDLAGALATVAPTNNNTELVAFVLVSHGKNGNGAYTGNSDTDQFLPFGALMGRERENADRDRTFVSIPVSTIDNDNDRIDDIIYWRTNHQIVHDFGGGNCTAP